MTPDTTKPGAALDALVAQAAGWMGTPQGESYQVYAHPPGSTRRDGASLRRVPEYSRDVAAAFALLEEFTCHIDCLLPRDKCDGWGRYRVKLCIPTADGKFLERTITRDADTLPMAICKVFLAAKGAA